MSALVAVGVATPLGGGGVERACAAGGVHVAVVVDIGSGGSASAVCVPGTSGDSDATILAARASMLGLPQPRYNAVGLLCSIDGVPATGCGVVRGGHYSYWSYWHGVGGKWVYSNAGPAMTRADSATVEGWRWQPDGSGLPTDPAPRGPATAAAVCVPQPPSTTTPASTAAVAPTTTAGGPLPSVAVQQAPTTSTSPTSASSSTITSIASATVPSTVSTVSVGGRPGGRASGSSSPSSSIVLTTGGIAPPPAKHAAGVPVGLVVGVVLVGGLGAGGAIAARRRSGPAS